MTKRPAAPGVTDILDIRSTLEYFKDLGVRDFYSQVRPQRPPAAVQGSASAPVAVDLQASPTVLAGGGDAYPGPFASLAEVGREARACTRCRLAATRRQAVVGTGNPEADLMFVGEAPGRDEDLQGEPFVGRAGQLLTKIIEAIGMERDQVYICNVIKCRPPENRDPAPDEVAACRPFLEAQLEWVRPRVIVTLGGFGARAVLGTDEPIGRLRGCFQDRRGVAVMPTFHPAYLLRSPERKREVWEDMKKVRAFLAT